MEPVRGKRCLAMTIEQLNNLYSGCVAGRDRLVSGSDGYPVVQRIEPAEEDLLRRERNVKQAWLRDHDYIGTKIATGRATIEDYADEIRTMREYAERIEEIDLQLGGQNEEAD